VRRGLVYHADLITQAIPGVRPLSAVVNAAAGEPTLDAGGWRAIGACLRRFHDAGADHADLNAHNVLLEVARVAAGTLAPDAGVHLVDFDRGLLRAAGAGTWRERNLERFERSLRKVTRGTPERFGPEQWALVREGYAGLR
jgi:3-deoxy-D-manno-octulosonic acid kinase